MTKFQLLHNLRMFDRIRPSAAGKTVGGLSP